MRRNTINTAEINTLESKFSKSKICKYIQNTNPPIIAIVMMISITLIRNPIIVDFSEHYPNIQIFY